MQVLDLVWCRFWVREEEGQDMAQAWNNTEPVVILPDQNQLPQIDSDRTASRAQFTDGDQSQNTYDDLAEESVPGHGSDPCHGRRGPGHQGGREVRRG